MQKVEFNLLNVIWANQSKGIRAYYNGVEYQSLRETRFTVDPLPDGCLETVLPDGLLTDRCRLTTMVPVSEI